MKLIFNRFAITPVFCSTCKRYVWLEKYRRSDVYSCLKFGLVKENICNECIKKYDVGGKRNG